jgi:hypothetical protein
VHDVDLNELSYRLKGISLEDDWIEVLYGWRGFTGGRLDIKLMFFNGKYQSEGGIGIWSLSSLSSGFVANVESPSLMVNLDLFHQLRNHAKLLISSVFDASYYQDYVNLVWFKM